MQSRVQEGDCCSKKVAVTATSRAGNFKEQQKERRKWEKLCQIDHKNDKFGTPNSRISLTFHVQRELVFSCIRQNSQAGGSRQSSIMINMREQCFEP